MKRLMLKAVSLILGITLLLLPLGSAMAAGVSPLAVGSVGASKSVSGTSVTGVGYAVFGTTESSASIVLVLQQKRSGTWYNYKTSTTKTAKNCGSIEHTYTFSAAKGYEYRIKVTATSTNSLTGYSSSFSI